MEDVVQIPVEIGGLEREFEALVQSWRYGIRFIVDVDEVQVIFERDEAGEYRAVLPEGFNGKTPDRVVIEAIIRVLEVLGS